MTRYILKLLLLLRVSGAYVVISTGQTLLLDMDTPVLFFLLVDGGTVIFDDKDIHLQAEHILIAKNGTFMVGTEEKPFEHKAIITLHGNVTSKELPVYGAKSISLRTGYLGLHGQHVLNTWTRLSQTAEAGASEIHVTVAVPDWKVGSEIVIASTSKSLRENEPVHITGVSNNGQTIQISPPLKYKHIALTQTIAGRSIETAAEVGLLTRNVVIRGSSNENWKDAIEPCPEDYNPDQFATQSCFEVKTKFSFARCFFYNFFLDSTLSCRIGLVGNMKHDIFF